MDIVSHGLWGGVAFGRKSKLNFLIAFLFGIVPDLFSFGLLFMTNLTGITGGPHYSNGRPDAAMIPGYVHLMYNITHSLIIFLAVFLLVWIIRKKPFWLMGAWGLHILVDIPTHGKEFFPTPFLWPVSDFKVDGINWGNPMIFFPNLILLAIAYLIWGVIYYRNKKRSVIK